MATAAAPPDSEGWCSLSLHAGGTSAEMIRAAADPQRLLVVETSPNYPRTFGVPPEHMHALKVDEIDILVEGDGSPLPLPDVEPTETDLEIAKHAAAFVPDGATLQTGIGTIPSAIATRLADGEKGDFGVHSEMFTNGLMALHEAGQGLERTQGLLRRRLGRHVRGRLGGALRVAPRERGRRVPSGRARQLDRGDRPQPQDDHDQRRPGDRRPRAGGRRHDQRHAVLRHRRARGLHRRPGARRRGPLAPVLPRHVQAEGRRASVAHRARGSRRAP